MFSSFYDMRLQSLFDIHNKTLKVDAYRQKEELFSVKIHPRHVHSIHVFTDALPEEEYFDKYEMRVKLESEIECLNKERGTKTANLETLTAKAEAQESEVEKKKIEMQVKQTEIDLLEIAEKLEKSGASLGRINKELFDENVDIEAKVASAVTQQTEEPTAMEEEVEGAEGADLSAMKIPKKVADDTSATESSDANAIPAEVDAASEEAPPTPKKDGMIVVDLTGDGDGMEVEEAPKKVVRKVQKLRILVGLKEAMSFATSKLCNFTEDVLPSTYCVLLEADCGDKFETASKFLELFVKQCYNLEQQNCEEWAGKSCNDITSKLLKQAVKKCKLDFEQETCSNNCGNILRAFELEEHENKYCPVRMVNCEHCDEPHPYNQMEAHHQVCEKYPLPCPNKCGKKIQRANLETHMENTCLLQVIACPYAKYGCKQTFRRKDRIQHLRKKNPQHLSLVEKCYCVLQKRQDAMISFLQDKFSEDCPDFNNIGEDREVVVLEE